jgi:hypothetical protein
MSRVIANPPSAARMRERAAARRARDEQAPSHRPPAAYDMRPGEACIINRTGARQVVTSAAYADARARPYRLCLEVDVVYIVPLHMGGRDAARQIALSYPVELMEDATRGALPDVIPSEDARAIHRWLHGTDPEPSRASVIEELVKKHDLNRPSLGECVLRLMREADYTEAAAVETVRGMWETALLERRAFRSPWVAETTELIAARSEDVRA